MDNSSPSFLSLISETKLPLLSDGAMGTVLHQKGIGFEGCFDALNLSNPAMVAEIHHEYIEAGSQIIQTNTFGANRFKLAKHGLEKQVSQINQAGVELARRVVLASFRNVLIAGDVGPLGVRLAPFGRVQWDQAREIFQEQVEALVSAGVDLIIIETMTDLHEVNEAILATRTISKEIPVIASMTFTRDDRTILGDTPARVAEQIHSFGADVIGINCSGGPHQTLRLLKQMRHSVPDGKFSVMPNAGWPEQSGGRIMYPAGADYFKEYAISFALNGASVIGGCCGTTPPHINAMKEAIGTIDVNAARQMVEVMSPKVESASVPGENKTRLAQTMASDRFAIAVEMDPPRGLSTHKLLAGASLLAESGADVINIADSPMARMRMSPWAVCRLIQESVDIETVLHFPTRGRNLLRVQGDLLAAHALGVRNVFVVMGDPTAIGDYPDAMDNYDLVPSGLIKLIKKNFNTGVDHAGSTIGQPTSFFVGCALNLNSPDAATEIKNFRRKVQSGADFALTQPIYDPSFIDVFIKKYSDEFGAIPIPILIGILPLASARHANFLHAEVPGISIPEEILKRMNQAGEKAAQVGITITNEIVSEIKSSANGIYLMPAFNRFDYAAEIIDNIRKS